MKYRAYMLNFDEDTHAGSHWVAIYVKNDDILIVLVLKIFQKR